MKSVKWLRPYMTAASKYHGIKETGFLSRERREAMNSREHWLPLIVSTTA